jgi:hypothetical protein
MTLTTGSVPLGLSRMRPSPPSLFSASTTALSTSSITATAFADAAPPTGTLMSRCG